MFEPALLTAASDVIVIRGGGYDPSPGARIKKRRQRTNSELALLVEREPGAIEEIAELLTRTVPGATPMDWMEWQQISFVFLAGGRVLREIGLLSGAAHVRDVEFHDLPLVDPASIDQWLLARGVEMPYPP